MFKIVYQTGPKIVTQNGLYIYTKKKRKEKVIAFEESICLYYIIGCMHHLFQSMLNFIVMWNSCVIRRMMHV